ncbi:helix-turn-helix domain-containing protein [uncultured Parabacteroides sp.]|uniref:AraC family transcriptional regulator n=1 Tax=uncultured Parabacteroides sp. TaxID=512312 RepID=UPI0026300AE7|nr:helix-turn-helix domain-containing protein [uncultured Parabacteroides sp.]
MSGYTKKIAEPNSGVDYSLEKDFKVYTLSKELPITTYPSYMELGIVIYCLKGNAKIDIYSNKHIITPKELIIILPGQLVSLTDVSVDFQIRYFTITESFYTDILSGISRFSPHFFFYMRQHYYFKVEDVKILSFIDFFEILTRKAFDTENQYRRESVILLLRIFFLDIYNFYKVNSLDNVTTIDIHKKELTHKFFQLVMNNYKVNRSVTFYANSLCITPKYLTMVVKEVSGKSAKDWITEYMILELKGLLTNSTLNIQEIVEKTKFSNQSSLGRFFRRHTGLSPLQYRKEYLTIDQKTNFSKNNTI